eukprot:13650020-Ditylum_brightwellii.AAC.1
MRHVVLILGQICVEQVHGDKAARACDRQAQDCKWCDMHAAAQKYKWCDMSAVATKHVQAIFCEKQSYVGEDLK